MRAHAMFLPTADIKTNQDMNQMHAGARELDQRLCETTHVDSTCQRSGHANCDVQSCFVVS